MGVFVTSIQSVLAILIMIAVGYFTQGLNWLPILASNYHGEVKFATNVVVATSVLFIVVVPVIMVIQSI